MESTFEIDVKGGERLVFQADMKMTSRLKKKKDHIKQ